MLRKLGSGSNGACGRNRSCPFRNRGPKLHPGFGDSAGGDRHAPCKSSYAPRGHRDPGHSASGDCHAAGQYGNSSNRTTESEHAGLCFAEHNPKYKYARIHFTRNADPGQHHTAFDDQSEHTEYSRQLAQRFSVRNVARHPKRLARFSAQRRVLNDQSINPRKRKQSGFHWR